ncbi:MAG: lysine--tRNA ligase [Promethearchaeota archaeon]
MNDIKKYEIHWLEDIKHTALERNPDVYTLSTGKTPSGSIHLGILREITICDSLKRALVDEGKKVRFLLFFDSMDAAKKFPSYIPKDFKKYLGRPFSDIPCPDKSCNCESYAHHWGNELVSTFEEFGLTPEIVWSHELYNTPEMKEKIKMSLDNTEKIKKIIIKYISPTLDEESRIAYVKQMENWYPAMVVCSKCGTTQYNDKKLGKIFANRVLEYYPETGEIYYECPNPKCKHSERVKIEDARIKLNWRVDWPAKWAIYNTTCEPAGKDHSVKGGSYDTGLELCKEIFDYQGPIKIPYEWLRLGDQDMSTSGGIVFNPREYLNIGAFPEAFRYLIIKTKPMTHISFRVENLPLLIDDYERFEKIFYGYEKVEDAELELVRYMFPLTQINGVPDDIPTRIPFRYAVVMSQIQELLAEDVLKDKCNEMAMRANPAKNPKPLSLEEIKDYLSRVKYWVDTYGPKQYRFNISKDLDLKVVENLTDKQRDALLLFHEYFSKIETSDAQALQNAIFNIAKEKVGISPKKVFQAIYRIFLGKSFGPRLGPFLIALDKKFVLERLEKAAK